MGNYFQVLASFGSLDIEEGISPQGSDRKQAGVSAPKTERLHPYPTPRFALPLPFVEWEGSWEAEHSPHIYRGRAAAIRLSACGKAHPRRACHKTWQAKFIDWS